jgi:hypothetical protein
MEDDDPLDLDPSHYANGGLSRSAEYLEEMRTEVFNFDIGVQAAFANAIYKKYAGREDFARLRLPFEADISKWNVTDIGNLAYMTLYAHPSVRDEYELKHRETVESITSSTMTLPQRRISWTQRCICM